MKILTGTYYFLDKKALIRIKLLRNLFGQAFAVLILVQGNEQIGIGW